MLLFYIRHGDPIYKPDMLTPLGETQAEAVARRLALFGIDEVYSSTSNRAMQTAKPTCELLGLPLHTLDYLNENYLSGLRMPDDANSEASHWVWAHPRCGHLLSSREVRSLGDGWYKHPEFERYHFEQVLDPIWSELDGFLAGHGYEHDCEKGLYRVTQRNAEKRVAVFAHECMGKIVMSHLLDIPFPTYASHFEMHTSGITVIRFDDGIGLDEPLEYARARVLTLSNDGHLYREDISLDHRYTRFREPF